MCASAAREKLPRCRDGEAARSTRVAVRCRSSRMRKQCALALLLALESIADDMGTTLSVCVPKGTPNDVGRRLNSTVVRALANPTVRRRLVDFPNRPADAAAAFQKAERNGGRSSRKRTSLLGLDIGSSDDRPPLLDLGLLKSTQRLRTQLLPRRDFLSKLDQSKPQRGVA